MNALFRALYVTCPVKVNEIGVGKLVSWVKWSCFAVTVFISVGQTVEFKFFHQHTTTKQGGNSIALHFGPLFSHFLKIAL